MPVQFSASLDEKNCSRQIKIVTIWARVNILTNKLKINGHNNICQYNKIFSSKISIWFLPFSGADNNWLRSLLTLHFQHFQRTHTMQPSIFLKTFRKMIFIKNTRSLRRRWISMIHNRNITNTQFTPNNNHKTNRIKIKISIVINSMVDDIKVSNEVTLLNYKHRYIYYYICHMCYHYLHCNHLWWFDGFKW